MTDVRALYNKTDNEYVCMHKPRVLDHYCFILLQYGCNLNIYTLSVSVTSTVVI